MSISLAQTRLHGRAIPEEFHGRGRVSCELLRKLFVLAARFSPYRKRVLRPLEKEGKRAAHSSG
jgi:hypothetical protein